MPQIYYQRCKNGICLTLATVLVFASGCKKEADKVKDVPSYAALDTIAIKDSINWDMPTIKDLIDSLRQIIPTVTGEQKFSFKELSQDFSFKELSQDVWNWRNSQKFIEIDSAIWVNSFNKPTKLYPYGYSSGERVGKKIYYYKIFDFKDNLFNLIVLKYVSNDRSCMYLVQFDKQGNRKKTLKLAYIEKGPEWNEEIYSLIRGNEITTYRYYDDDNDDNDYKDTVVTLW